MRHCAVNTSYFSLFGFHLSAFYANKHNCWYNQCSKRVQEGEKCKHCSYILLYLHYICWSHWWTCFVCFINNKRQSLVYRNLDTVRWFFKATLRVIVGHISTRHSIICCLFGSPLLLLCWQLPLRSIKLKITVTQYSSVLCQLSLTSHSKRQQTWWPQAAVWHKHSMMNYLLLWHATAIKSNLTSISQTGRTSTHRHLQKSELEGEILPRYIP